MESYSRGRRGVPAKDVGVERRARVQIPHSPPIGTAFAHAVLLFLPKRYFCNYYSRKKIKNN